jgi:hypothetical protein
VPLAQLVSVPRTPAELSAWSFANVANHRDIIRRVQETKGVLLPEFIVDPFDPQDPASLSSFLANNWQMHVMMAETLGIASNILNAVDWNDEQALAEWVFEHYTEHQAASQLLGIS